jgi:autotransporter adhesin
MTVSFFRAALLAAAVLPFAFAANAHAQEPQVCPDNTTGPGDKVGTGNASCNTTTSAFGRFNLASGFFSSAFGRDNTASGNSSSAFGRDNTASGGFSSAFGSRNTATGDNSNAFGITNTASGGSSSAFGWSNTASGLRSSAFGYGNTADGFSNSAFGYLNTASGFNSAAFGYHSTTGADAQGALAVGGWYDRNGNELVNIATETTFALGRFSAAVGTGVRAEGEASSAFGVGSRATALRASAFGYDNLASGGIASAFGYRNTASSELSSAFGIQNTASDVFSSAFGSQNTASGNSSSAFGRNNTASGPSSNAVGQSNTATNFGTSAFGRNNTAIGDTSNAFGWNNAAGGAGASAFGSANTASSNSSAAFGRSNIASGLVSSAFGTQNTAQGGNSAAFGYLSTTGADARGALAVGGWYDRNDDGLVNAATETTFALGRYSVAVGTGVRAEADFSSAFGVGSVASAEGATAIGFEAVADRAYTVSFGSDGDERNLIHVADAVEETDAVNLRQMTGLTGALDTRITANTDGRTLLGADVGALDGRVTTAESDIAALQGQISTGGVGLVLQAGADATVTVAAATGGAEVDFAGTDGARTLSGVADGEVSASSGEAVTGAQLFASNTSFTAGIDLANQRVAASLGAGAGYDAATGVFTAPSFTVMGAAYGDVGGAIGALNTQVGENTSDIADIKAAGGGTGGGGSDPAQDARIAALEAQLAALQSTLQTQNEALQMAMGELGELRDGNVTGGTTTDGSNLAVGPGSQATGFGDTAVGVGASAAGDPSTAVGYQALASGRHSTAIGGNAEATGDLSTALGQGSVASGANSLALGQGAQATHANAIAIGQGVQTTRDDQVAIGSASSTYTLAGISSPASRAAQSGPVFAVTADGAGNLATMDMQPWFGRIEGLEESVRQTDDRFRTQADGIAVALALGGAQVIQPGQTFALSANMGHFDGANAAGFGAIGRLEENVFVNLGVGHGFRTGTVAGRAGVSWGW